MADGGDNTRLHWRSKAAKIHCSASRLLTCAFQSPDMLRRFATCLGPALQGLCSQKQTVPSASQTALGASHGRPPTQQWRIYNTVAMRGSRSRTSSAGGAEVGDAAALAPQERRNAAPMMRPTSPPTSTAAIKRYAACTRHQQLGMPVYHCSTTDDSMRVSSSRAVPFHDS